MNGTDHFKRTIQAYLDSRAAEDKLFAASYHKPNKSIDECVEHRRVRGLYPQLGEEKRLQRLHGRRNLLPSRTLLSKVVQYQNNNQK